jgi:hypothetical protein
MGEREGKIKKVPVTEFSLPSPIPLELPNRNAYKTRAR